jgi:hypothetical protein
VAERQVSPTWKLESSLTWLPIAEPKTIKRQLPDCWQRSQAEASFLVLAWLEL